eukprot:3670046-Amphidinium_carterae.1
MLPCSHGVGECIPALRGSSRPNRWPKALLFLLALWVFSILKARLTSVGVPKGKRQGYITLCGENVSGAARAKRN